MDDSSNVITALLSTSGNDSCMECDSTDVEWVSVNLGVFLCQSCSNRHRHLGTQISRVKSLHIDTNAWSEKLIQQLKNKGNINAKYYFESRVPLYQVRPPNDLGPSVIEDWIRCKYQQQLFIDPHSANNIYYTIPRPVQNSLTSHSGDDTKSNNMPNFAIHKMPISPTQIISKWIVPNAKYQTKNQFIVLHDRFLSRYATPSSHKCEQIIDITKQQVWISQSELNNPCVLAIGEENTNDCMRLEFEHYKDAKYYTELIRRSALFYSVLAKKTCAAVPNDTILSLLSCSVTEFNNNSVYKQLKYGNVKRQQKFSIGWDKKWWCINSKRKILLYFSKDPRSIKPSKKNPLFLEAQGGFYLNEITADIDNDGYRSKEQHCMLLYNFEKTIFIKFEERWPLIEFWKHLHLQGRDVNFIAHKPMYYEKALCQQNVDVQIMLIKQKSPRIMGNSANINPIALVKKETLDGFDMDSHSPSGSPEAPPTYEDSEVINGIGIGTAIMNHELLAADTKMAVTDHINKPTNNNYEASITDFNQFNRDQMHHAKLNNYQYGAKQKDKVSTLEMLMKLHKQTSASNDEVDAHQLYRNLSYDPYDDEDYDMQIDDEYDPLSLNKQDTGNLNAPKQRKATTTATEASFNAEFGIYSVDGSRYAADAHGINGIQFNNKMLQHKLTQDTDVMSMEDSVLYDDPARYQLQNLVPILKQSGSISSTCELSGACELQDPEEDDDDDELKIINNATTHMKAIGSLTELQFYTENTPNLPDDDIGSPSSKHLREEDIITPLSTIANQMHGKQASFPSASDKNEKNDENIPKAFGLTYKGTVSNEVLSEEEDVMYKDHRRGTVQKFADKNKYKSRTYRKFAKTKVLDSIKELKGCEASDEKDANEVPPPPPMAPPPQNTQVAIGNKNKFMRQYMLNVTQAKKLNDAEMMQDIMMQVGNVASFFVQPGNKLFVHLHGASLSQSRRNFNAKDHWKHVETLLQNKIGNLQIIK